MLTRRVEQVLTATTSDAFNNTDLRQAPGPGAVGIFAASDVQDSTISIRIGGISYTNASVIPNKGTNAPIQEFQDAPQAVAPVRGGELINVDIVEVTAANIRLIAVWQGL